MMWLSYSSRSRYYLSYSLLVIELVGVVLLKDVRVKVDKAKVTEKVERAVQQGRVGRFQKKAFSFAFAKMINKLGLMEVPKRHIEMVFEGRAEELPEDELISIGTVIKQFHKKNLDVLLFVKECKAGVYRGGL